MPWNTALMEHRCHLKAEHWAPPTCRGWREERIQERRWRRSRGDEDHQENVATKCQVKKCWAGGGGGGQGVNPVQ